MKKIVHVIDNLKVGGAEILLFSVIKKLPGIEHHVIMLSPDIVLTDIKDLAHVHCIHHTGWLSLLQSCKRIRNLVKTIQPDVVHSHLFLSSFITRLALRNAKNVIYSIHNLYSATIFKSTVKTFLEKLVYNPKHKLISVSKYVLDDYRTVVDKCKSGYVLYNFIDDSFIEKAKGADIKPSSQLKKWVAVGSLKPQKNYDQMLDLFGKLCKTEAGKNISLDILGDGPLRAHLEAKINKLNLPIYLKGNVKNIKDLLGNYDAYISCSLYEGYGIAPMEALAIGIPVFVSNIPVYKEIYKDYAFLFDINPINVQSFLQCCDSYQTMNYDQKIAMMLKGQEYAMNIANSESYISRLMDIYSDNNDSGN